LFTSTDYIHNIKLPIKAAAWLSW